MAPNLAAGPSRSTKHGRWSSATSAAAEIVAAVVAGAIVTNLKVTRWNFRRVTCFSVERVARLQLPGIKTFLEPSHSLFRGSVSKTFRDNIALSFHLQLVVAD